MFRNQFGYCAQVLFSNFPFFFSELGVWLNRGFVKDEEDLLVLTGRVCYLPPTYARCFVQRRAPVPVPVTLYILADSMQARFANSQRA